MPIAVLSHNGWGKGFLLVLGSVLPISPRECGVRYMAWKVKTAHIMYVPTAM